MKVLIIGGVACGPKVAARLRRLNGEAEITILEKGGIVSYGGCGMPYYISGDVPEIEELWSTAGGVARDTRYFANVKDVRVITHMLAQRIDRRQKRVEALHLDTGEREVFDYDKLVLAVGGTPVVPPIDGIHVRNVFKLHHPEDAEDIMKAIREAKIRQTVIVGGGLIGLEMVEALTGRGLQVVVVEMLDRLLPRLLDREVSALLMKHLQARGVALSLENRVLRFNADARGDLVSVTTDRGEIPAQLVLIAIGVRPNGQIAREAGLTIHPDGSIEVDEYLRTSDPDIYAGGDCVSNRHLTLGRYIHTPLGDLANLHGRIIANNLNGGRDRFEGSLGTAVCKVFDYNAASTGLTEETARSEGLDIETVLCPGLDKAHFYPTAQMIFIKLVGERPTGRILGAQIVGPGDVAKRINLVSLGLRFGIGADEMGKLDLAYAPPFSPAIDNIMTAAHILQNKIRGLARGISAAELKGKLDRGEDFVPRDVRDPAEVQEYSLPYASVVNIPLGELRRRFRELPEGKEIVTFCTFSLRAYEGLRILAQKGFSDVKFLDGGLAFWPY